MIAEHLTFRQIQDYVAKRLPPDQIPGLHRHIDSCPDCRNLLVVTVTGSTEHLSEQQAVDFVAAKLSPGDHASAAAHLETCASCAAIVADLQEFTQSDELRQPTPFIVVPKRNSLRKWMLPAAAALFAVAGVSAWLALRTGHSEPPVASELRDAGGHLKLNQNGPLTAGFALPAGAAELMATTLRSGRLPSGPDPFAAEPNETLRSSTPSASAQSANLTLFPNGIRVLSDRPEFRWQPATDATAWRITVTDEDLNPVARSGVIQLQNRPTASWIPGSPLPRQQPLLWQLSELRQGTWVIATPPPAPSPRFEIVSADIAQQINAALTADPPSHLWLAILYSKAGLHNEANSEIEAFAALNPGSSIAASLTAR